MNALFYYSIANAVASSAMNKQNRIEWIDAAKGIAIIAVMFGHSPLHCSFYFCIWVPMFFILAGYTYNNKSKKTTIEFIKNKSLRLLLPYFCFSAIYLLIGSGVYLFIKNDIASAARALIGVLTARPYLCTQDHAQQTYFMVVGNGPLWFLPTMFLGYCLFHVIDAQNLTRKLIFSGGCVILIAAILRSPILLPWAPDVACFCALCMMIGKWWHQLDNRFTLSPYTSVFTSMIALMIYEGSRRLNGDIALSCSSYTWHPDTYLPGIILAFIMTIAGTYAVCRLLQTIENTLICKVLSSIGRISILLLCTHKAAGMISQQITAHLPLSGAAEQLFHLTWIISVAFLLKAFFQSASGRFPFLRYLY